jgi:hypothetical protein
MNLTKGLASAGHPEGGLRGWTNRGPCLEELEDKRGQVVQRNFGHPIPLGLDLLHGEGVGGGGGGLDADILVKGRASFEMIPKWMIDDESHLQLWT